ncbi:MAG: hypothetical protein CTY15_08555 [Methylocystis sp.]|nr:MAG: hypothetical protein CTY15_08555 [Methylocystis sp.]
MKPRLTHLLFATVALAAILGGVAVLRYMPGQGGTRGAQKQTAMVGAPHPAGGSILPGLRRTTAPPQAARTPVAPPPVAPLPPVAQSPQPAPPLPEAPPLAQASAPAPALAPAPAPAPVAETQAEGVEGLVSFPPEAPVPPARPADLARAPAVPLPPTRPSDLAALETPAPEPSAATPQPAPAQPAAPQTQPQPPQSQPWSFPWPQAHQPAPETPQAPGAAPAPVYADVPTPPTRPADLEALAARAAQPAQQAAAAPATAPAAESAPAASAAQGQQVARLPEPALRPAPDDAFTAPPPKVGMGDPVFVRIFKQEGQLELWLKKGGRYTLYKTFPICKWSGRLGPKIREADYQSPEGFYSVSAKQLNPHSNYYRAFNVGYPNAFDRQNGRTGGLVMVHGSCKSVGCFAMTDRGIEEIYGFVEAALRAGQKEIPVHIFPFRMSEHNIARETGGGWLAFVAGGGYAQWSEFWKNLKQGHDLFEQTGEPPVAFACGDHYEFGGGSATCRRVAGW